MDRARRFLLGSLLCVSLAGLAACHSNPNGSSSSGSSPGSSAPATLSAITVNPTTVDGGKTTTATITLTEPAPAGGAVIMLSATSDSVIFPMINTFSGPIQQVTIPVGKTTFNFKIQTIPVGSNQTVQISATYLATETVLTTLTLTSSNPLSVTAFTVNGSSFTSGQTLVGTVTLNAPAYSPGQQVFLASSDASVQPENPATVPTNAKSVQFSIFTSPLAAQRVVTITASLNSSSIPVQVTLLPTGTAITSLVVIPFTAAGGASMTGMVTVSPPAPSGGAVISLTAAFSDVATAPNTPLPVTLPSTVTVAAGMTQAQFTVNTMAVKTTTDVTLTATLNSTGTTFVVEIVPTLALAGISCPSIAVTTGNAITCSVGLTIPAPAGGETVMLTSSNPTALALPASIVVPAGASSVPLNLVGGVIGTTPVPVTMTGTLQGSKTGSVTNVLTVVPVNALNLTSFTLSATVVQGGAAAIGPAPTGAVESGNMVTLNTLSPHGLAVGQAITVSGVMVAGYNGTFMVAAVPTPTSLSYTDPTGSLGPSGAGTVQGSVATNVTGSITIAPAGAPPGGLAVNLSSSDPSVQFPNGPTVTVPQNSLTATFPIATTLVASQVSVTITANVNAYPLTATLTIVPPAQVVGLSVAPMTVVGGNSVVGTVTLSVPAPQFGTTVMLQSNSAQAQIGTSVAVTQGNTTATFAITTLPVNAQQMATITATLGASSKQASVTITPVPPDLRLLYLNPATVQTGQTSTGTVVLTAPAPAGGVSVSLSSTSTTTTVTVPNSVTVPAGATSATFLIRAMSGVTAATTAVISGEVTSSASSSLGVIPAATGTVTEQIVLGGETDSTDFKTTSSAFQGMLASGDDTGFLTNIGLNTPVNSTTTTSYTFSTYLGGMSSFGQVRDTFVDSSGNVYGCGVTMDSKLPTTKNAAQAAYGGGKDAFIAEFNSSGVLQYLSYLGGSGDETCNSLTVDSSGNIYVSGSETDSTAMGATNLMGTSGAFQMKNAGGSDMFVAKLNPGTSGHVIWLTFVGGAGDDFADGRIAESAGGVLVLSGTSKSTGAPPNGFPIPASQGRPALTGVGSFGVVVALSNDGTTLIASTLLFGGTNGANPGTPTTTTVSGGVALDAAGNAHVCGQTNASNLPVTSNAFQPALLGQQDAYIAVISASGVIMQMTYLGGTSASTVQACKGIAVDRDMNTMVVMPTDAADYPLTTGGALSGPTDFAVTKLTSDLSVLIFSRLVGGSGTESADATRIQLDGAENLYFSLATNSADFPVTSNAVQATFAGASGGNNTNVAVVKLSSDGSTILYGSYLGGSTGTNSTTSIFYHLN